MHGHQTYGRYKSYIALGQRQHIFLFIILIKRKLVSQVVVHVTFRAQTKCQFVPKAMRTNVSVHLTFLVLKNIFAFVMFAITSKLYKFGEKIYRNVPNQVTTQLLSNEKFSPGLRYSNTIWVPDKKDGYRTQKEVSTKQHIIDGFKQLKNEVEVWRNEVKEHLLSDPVLIFRAGEVDALWTFSDDNDRKKFIVSADSDHNEGTSTCSLTKSPAGYGLFSGTLNSQPPLNGKVKRAGYCNITCMRPMVSLTMTKHSKNKMYFCDFIFRNHFNVNRTSIGRRTIS